MCSIVAAISGRAEQQVAFEERKKLDSIILKKCINFSSTLADIYPRAHWMPKLTRREYGKGRGVKRPRCVGTREVGSQNETCRWISPCSYQFRYALIWNIPDFVYEIGSLLKQFYANI
jgi:hypothetical protein